MPQIEPQEGDSRAVLPETEEMAQAQFNSRMAVRKAQENLERVRVHPLSSDFIIPLMVAFLTDFIGFLFELTYILKIVKAPMDALVGFLIGRWRYFKIKAITKAKEELEKVASPPPSIPAPQPQSNEKSLGAGGNSKIKNALPSATNMGAKINDAAKKLPSIAGAGEKMKAALKKTIRKSIITFIGKSTPFPFLGVFFCHTANVISILKEK